MHRTVHMGLGALAVLLAGCAGTDRNGIAVPAESYKAALAADPISDTGYTNIRYWGDGPATILPQAATRYAPARQGTVMEGGRFDMLALSGGSADGAFGAGFLAGWTAQGTRPHFHWVTGVSTGALIAPFAFLGPEHDADLKRLFTGVSTPDLLHFDILGVLGGASSIADSAPLAARINHEITPALVERIGAENARGRKLLIGTTNLDAQRPVVWDITAIAASDQPGRVDLIRRILLASTAIPGLLPPVEIKATVDGKLYREMHVDGGTTHEVIAYPVPLNIPGLRRAAPPPRTMWVLRNGFLGPEYEAVANGFTDIARRSISTLLKFQGRGDIAMLERLAERDGYRFRLTSIPKGNYPPAREIFDQKRMSSLYAAGLAYAQEKEPWSKTFLRR